MKIWISIVRSAQNNFGLIVVTSVNWVRYTFIFFYTWTPLQRCCWCSSYVVLIRKRKTERTLAGLHKQG